MTGSFDYLDDVFFCALSDFNDFRAQTGFPHFNKGRIVIVKIYVQKYLEYFLSAVCHARREDSLSVRIGG